MSSSTDTIAYFRNGLGNLVEMTPALQALGQLDGSGKVDVCLDSGWTDSRRPAVESFLTHLPFVHEVIDYPKQLIKRKYRCWFFTPHSEPSQAYHVFESQAKKVLPRVGWDKLYVREIDYYMEGVRRLGYAGTTPPLYCPVSEALSPPLVWEPDVPRVGLCNGSFGSMGPMKQWPYYKDLARVMHSFFDVSVVKLGHKEELKDVEADHDFVGKLDILETAHVISQLDLFITVDTGLMHIADALRIPMIVVWGATLVSKNGPVNGTAKVLRANIPCQPCQYTNMFEKCTKLECLRLLSVGEVMAHVRAIL